MAELIGNCPKCTQVVVRWVRVDTNSKGGFFYEVVCPNPRCGARLEVNVRGAITVSLKIDLKDKV